MWPVEINVFQVLQGSILLGLQLSFIIPVTEAGGREARRMWEVEDEMVNCEFRDWIFGTVLVQIFLYIFVKYIYYAKKIKIRQVINVRLFKRSVLLHEYFMWLKRIHIAVFAYLNENYFYVILKIKEKVLLMAFRITKNIHQSLHL